MDQTIEISQKQRQTMIYDFEDKNYLEMREKDSKRPEHRCGVEPKLIWYFLVFNEIFPRNYEVLS